MSRKITPKEAAEQLQNIRIIYVGQDLVIEKTEEHITDDIQQELRDIANS